MIQQPEIVYSDTSEEGSALQLDAVEIVRIAYLDGGFTTKSDVARAYATEVALAASLGLITTVLPGETAFTNKWRVTPKGLALLYGAAADA